MRPTRRNILAGAALPLIMLTIVGIGQWTGSWWTAGLVAAAIYYALFAAFLVRRSRLGVRLRRRVKRPPHELRLAQRPLERPHRALLADDRPAWLVSVPSAVTRRKRLFKPYLAMTIGEIRVSAMLARSEASREIFAYRATSGRMHWDEMQQLLVARDRDGQRERADLLLGPIERSAAMALALLLQSEALLPGDREAALALMRLIIDRWGWNELALDNRRAHLSLLLRCGYAEEATRMLALNPGDGIIEHQLLADAMNPFSGAGEEERQWLIAFNRIFSEFGLERMRLLPGTADEAPFDRLAVADPLVPSESREDEPSVTVIMAAFQPGRETVSAVRSVVAQTWSNWNLIIVDDASGPGYDAIFEECVSLDERISLQRMPENVGTYACRNEALSRATGDLVTILDSDDWMHPRRLELHVRHLAAHSKQLANISYGLRVTEDLRFVHDRGTSVKLCEPSLMFRREATLSAIGVFDPVRKGADSEYRWRIGAAQGHQVAVLDMLPPLTLQRFDTRSLSGGDFIRGWVHPARLVYRSAWWQWHRNELDAGRVPMIRPGDPRPFPAPGRMSGAPRDGDESRFDLVFIMDFAARAGNEDRLGKVAELLRTAAGNGHRTAVMHLWSMGPQPHTHLLQSSIIQALVNEGVVHQVLLDEPKLQIGAAIVTQPELLQFAPFESAAWRPDRVIVPAPPTGDRYLAEECDANAVRVFGPSVEWLSQEELLRVVARGDGTGRD